MEVADITFMAFMGVGILAFTTMAFAWRGIVWLSWLAAIFWLLLGVWCRVNINVCFMFQREIGILFMGIFLAMMFAPFYMKTKDVDIMDNPTDDIDIWSKQYASHRKKIDRQKSLKQKRY